MVDITESTRNDSVVVGTSSTLISDTRERRTAIYLKNTSTGSQVITVCFGNKAAVLYEGVTLSVGDVVIDSNGEAYLCYQGQIQAISSAADGRISVYER
jgi:hypothetical protein